MKAETPNEKRCGGMEMSGCSDEVRKSESGCPGRERKGWKSGMRWLRKVVGCFGNETEAEGDIVASVNAKGESTENRESNANTESKANCSLETGGLEWRCTPKEVGEDDGRENTVESFKEEGADDGQDSECVTRKEEGCGIDNKDLDSQKEKEVDAGLVYAANAGKEEGEEDGPTISDQDALDELYLDSVAETMGNHGLQISAILGQGGMGTVVEATILDAGIGSNVPCDVGVVAVKVVRKESDILEELAAEVSLHAEASAFLNVVTQYGSFDDEWSRFIVMERVYGGDLWTYLEDHGPMAEVDSLEVMAQVFGALEFLHCRGMAHLDIKPENLMFQMDPMSTGTFLPQVRVVDFGLAFRCKPDENVFEDVCDETCGTPGYVAPEVCELEPYSPAAADIWSVGSLLFSLLTCSVAYEAQSFTAISRTMRADDGKALDVLEGIDGLTEDTRGLIRRCMSLKPLERPTASEGALMVESLLARRRRKHRLADGFIFDPG